MPTTLPARPPLSAQPDDELPPPRLDAHCDRIVARLTARLAARTQSHRLAVEPAHDFLVLGGEPPRPERGA